MTKRATNSYSGVGVIDIKQAATRTLAYYEPDTKLNYEREAYRRSHYIAVVFERNGSRANDLFTTFYRRRRVRHAGWIHSEKIPLVHRIWCKIGQCFGLMPLHICCNFPRHKRTSRNFKSSSASDNWSMRTGYPPCFRLLQAWTISFLSHNLFQALCLLDLLRRSFLLRNWWKHNFPITGYCMDYLLD